MTGFYFSSIVGTRGEIWIPTLSVLVARLERPTLTRRPPGSDTPTVGQFDFQAAYSFLNRALFDDSDFRKEITVFIGKQPLKVTLTEASKIEVIDHAKALRIEGVNAQ